MITKKGHCVPYLLKGLYLAPPYQGGVGGVGNKGLRPLLTQGALSLVVSHSTVKALT